MTPSFFMVEASCSRDCPTSPVHDMKIWADIADVKVDVVDGGYRGR
jgi:hypothetical protein